jgi:hypothetical protein
MVQMGEEPKCPKKTLFQCHFVRHERDVADLIKKSLAVRFNDSRLHKLTPRSGVLREKLTDPQILE